LGSAPRPAARTALALPVLALLSACGADHGADARAVATKGDPARGEQVFALAGGCGCHTPEKGPVGAGGVEIETPFGLFYSTNVTSDPTYGIGAWTDEEIARAIRSGTLRDGSVEAPTMPYQLYAGMADDDLRDLIAYLRTLPPAPVENRPHEVDLPLPRLAFRAWRLLFAGSTERPETAPKSGVERGRYLTDHVSICGDCHTPRTRFGALDHALYLAGTAHGPNHERVPNITTDDETGIGKWDQDEIVSLLKLGMKPDFDNVQGSMAEVVDGIAGGPGYGKAPDADLQAIAAYMKTVPPIDHVVPRKRATSERGERGEWAAWARGSVPPRGKEDEG
jgi:mono/diheme cytochrome c family protein